MQKGTLQMPMTRQELASLTSELPHIRALLVVSLQKPWRRIVVNVGHRANQSSIRRAASTARTRKRGR